MLIAPNHRRAPREEQSLVGLPSRSEIHQGGGAARACAIAGTTMDGPATEKKTSREAKQ